jgi:ketol-acid reductoisomerase
MPWRTPDGRTGGSDRRAQARALRESGDIVVKGQSQKQAVVAAAERETRWAAMSSAERHEAISNALWPDKDD